MYKTIDLDLHTHTSPQSACAWQSIAESIEKNCRLGIKILAITNHDTLDGLAEARKLCQACGIQFVNGVELTCEIQGESQELDGTGIHMLGLNVDDNPTLFNSYLNEVAERFHTRRLTHKQAVELIHRLHGVAVWAHPLRVYQHDRFTASELNDVVDRMCACGLNGLEVFHPDNLKYPNEVKTLLEIARSKKLFVTLGSDSHSVDDTHRYETLGQGLNDFDYDCNLIKPVVIK